MAYEVGILVLGFADAEGSRAGLLCRGRRIGVFRFAYWILLWVSVIIGLGIARNALEVRWLRFMFVFLSLKSVWFCPKTAVFAAQWQGIGGKCGRVHAQGHVFFGNRGVVHTQGCRWGFLDGSVHTQTRRFFPGDGSVQDRSWESEHLSTLPMPAEAAILSV